ncbi:hypothetical protein ACFJGV_10555 [Cnuibacter sp. UC19_7]|uniref:hypothetical protein n=1 Tax=Cnuibacter sp. UC19_7 TaxID=3350166 RepID=UPI00366FDC81
MSDAELLSARAVTHAMDYGYFTIAGGEGDSDELALLDQAQDSPPSASDGSMLVVLSPHQNNFAMEVEVQLWSAPPASDPDAWEQVSVESLQVGTSSTVSLGSPTLPSTESPIPEGRYWVEVSGRGFVAEGWPGSTEPGDRWRLRLWPHDGDLGADNPSHPRKEWAAPA